MKLYPAILLIVVLIAGRSPAAPDLEEVVLLAPGERYALRYLPIDGGNRVSDLRIVAAESGKTLWRYRGDGETVPVFSWSPNGNRLAISLRSVRWGFLTIVEFRDGAFAEVGVEIPDFPLKSDVPRESHEKFNAAKCEAWTDNATARLSFSGRCQLIGKDGVRLPKWVDYKYSGKLEFDPAQKSPTFTLNPESSIKIFGDTVEQGGAEQSATAPESKPEGDKKPKPESEGRSQ
jgi:hypothetical protein